MSQLQAAVTVSVIQGTGVYASHNRSAVVFSKAGRNSSVGTVVGRGLEDQGKAVRFLVGVKYVPLLQSIQIDSGTHQDSPLSVLDAVLPEVEQAGPDAKRAAPSNVDIKECAWNTSLHCPIRPHAGLHKDNFNFVSDETLYTD